jgi:flavodoxin
MKSLVVYYSRTGKTRFVAETIAAQLGSDIEEIVDLKRREGKMGWMSATRDASSGKETQIAPPKKISQNYDLLVIGTPVWAFNTTPAIRTYLNNNDLSGKKVALFFTFGIRLGQTVEKTKCLMPNTLFENELAVITSTQNDEEIKKKVAAWCNNLKLTPTPSPKKANSIPYTNRK